MLVLKSAISAYTALSPNDHDSYQINPSSSQKILKVNCKFSRKGQIVLPFHEEIWPIKIDTRSCLQTRYPNKLWLSPHLQQAIVQLWLSSMYQKQNNNNKNDQKLILLPSDWKKRNGLQHNFKFASKQKNALMTNRCIKICIFYATICLL